MAWKCFDEERRIQMEVLIRAGHSKKEMAAILGCHISTIYRELKRGRCKQLDWDYREYYVYSVAVAQADCLRLSQWMNTYPRQVLGWKTASEAFQEACSRENIQISAYLSQFLS